MAVALAKQYLRVSRPTRVLEVQNGWYAVVWGPVSPSSSASLKEQLVQNENAPSDLFFTTGRDFVKQVWFETCTQAASNDKCEVAQETCD
jgi:hypothetical protein